MTPAPKVANPRVANLRVAVLGHGAIGRSVADALAAGSVEGVELAGIVTRSGGAEALQNSDVVVECAGIEAVVEHGPSIVAAGIDLLIVSVGALVDRELRERVFAGPGRAYLSCGAIGGLDILGAAASDGGLDRVLLVSTKKATTLIQPWMDAATADALRTATEAVTVFEGGVAEAIRLFPASLNVGVALAAATAMWDETRVRLIADPAATLTTHRISAGGRAGEYDFSVSNHPLEDNPRTSAVVPAAILRGLSRLARPTGSFI